MNRIIVTLSGMDKVGIIAKVCTFFAENGINILDISQTSMDGRITMMMAVDVSGCDLPLAELAKRMEEKGKSMSLAIRLQREDIFEAMHRV